MDHLLLNFYNLWDVSNRREIINFFYVTRKPYQDKSTAFKEPQPLPLYSYYYL